MRHTPFPRSGEPISKLGFGAMGFAGWFGEANESDLRQYVPAYAGSLAALALKFVTQPAGVTTAITSMHVREHCRANVAALQEPALPAEIFDLLRFKHRFIKNFNETKIFQEYRSFQEYR